MKKATKTLLLMLCAVVLVVSSVLGTVAYLTSTASVENTFSVGNVTITMDEIKVNEYGEFLKNTGTEADPVYEVTTNKDEAARTSTNAYKLVPSQTYSKEPTIHVTAGSEPCYLFAKIENGLDGVATIDLDDNNWTLVDGETDVYAYSAIVDARTAKQDVAVFTKFTVVDGFEYNNTYAEKTIKVTGYAVQANGFVANGETSAAEAAWDATFGK